jgi:hypothetical protein
MLQKRGKDFLLLVGAQRIRRFAFHFRPLDVKKRVSAFDRFAFRPRITKHGAKVGIDYVSRRLHSKPFFQKLGLKCGEILRLEIGGVPLKRGRMQQNELPAASCGVSEKTELLAVQLCVL